MELTRECVIAATHPALPGHFPGRPVVPGVVLLDEVLRLAQEMGGGVHIAGVDGVKFLQPLLPQQPFTLHLTAAGGERWRFECRVAGERIALGYLLPDGAH